MAKKFVRGITNIKTISKQDFDTNNVNDILSDGEHNYIHRKKGNSEEYHNLTDNLKTISSTNTDLIDVTNNNTTNNTATLNPKHDAQKEQVLESTRNTITINHGSNGTPDKTTVDTNPQKVLEHENLLTSYGLSKTTSGNTTSLGVEYTKVANGFDLNTLNNGCVRSNRFINAPTTNEWYFVSSFTEGDFTIQEAIHLQTTPNIIYRRTEQSGSWSQWFRLTPYENDINNKLATKQNKLQSNSSVAVIGNTMRQLYALKQTYNVTGGLLKTHVKSVSENTNISTAEEEFNFIVKIDKSVSSVNFTLNTKDTTKFSNIINTYGSNNTVHISGCVFTLSGSTLTVSTTNNTNQNYVITFSDII